ALGLATLGTEWAPLVASHLLRLVVSEELPVGLASKTAPFCQRLRDLVFQGDTEDFWRRSAQLLPLFRGNPPRQLSLKSAENAAAGFLEVLADMGWELEGLTLELPNAAALAPLCRCNFSSLRLLALTSPETDMSLLQNLRMPQLTFLDLSRNSLSQEDAAVVAELLDALPLQTLLLGGNGLGPAGLGVLGPALARLKNLERLEVSQNGLGTTGLEMLPLTLALKSLSLRSNWLGPTELEVTGLRVVLADGLPCLFRGSGVNVVRSICMTVGTVPVYEHTKHVAKSSFGLADGPSLHLGAGLVAGVVGTTVAAP
ncbi:unnamed protein product, partial [Effrenium voratum]